MQEADLLPEGSPPRSTAPRSTSRLAITSHRSPPSHTQCTQTWKEKCPQQYLLHLRSAVSLFLERSGRSVNPFSAHVWIKITQRDASLLFVVSVVVSQPNSPLQILTQVSLGANTSHVCWWVSLFNIVHYLFFCLSMCIEVIKTWPNEIETIAVIAGMIGLCPIFQCGSQKQL